MSRMSDLQLEVVECLENGQTVNEITEALEIPYEWVEAVQVMMGELNQD